ncbi:thioredoxin-like protein [Hyaloraphidium curvatum]|nr:thioredoxin-like protein [Hyaloraphidium curvatum]
MASEKRAGMSFKIYHNPSCSTSRNVLSTLRAAGIEPTVVEYLKTPPTRSELENLVADCGVPVAAFVRFKEDKTGDMDLTNAGKWTPERLLDLLAEQPVFLERPIVVCPTGSRLCRPPELVLELLDEKQKETLQMNRL